MARWGSNGVEDKQGDSDERPLAGLFTAAVRLKKDGIMLWVQEIKILNHI